MSVAPAISEYWLLPRSTSVRVKSISDLPGRLRDPAQGNARYLTEHPFRFRPTVGTMTASFNAGYRTVDTIGTPFAWQQVQIGHLKKGF